MVDQIPASLTKLEWAQVLDALGDRPFKTAAPVIMKLQAQLTDFARKEKSAKPEGP